jgi:hypothetical protein
MSRARTTVGVAQSVAGSVVTVLVAGASMVGSNPALYRNPIEGMSGSIRFFRD